MSCIQQQQNFNSLYRNPWLATMIFGRYVGPPNNSMENDYSNLIPYIEKYNTEGSRHKLTLHSMRPVSSSEYYKRRFSQPDQYIFPHYPRHQFNLYPYNQYDTVVPDWSRTDSSDDPFLYRCIWDPDWDSEMCNCVFLNYAYGPVMNPWVYRPFYNMLY